MFSQPIIKPIIEAKTLTILGGGAETAIDIALANLNIYGFNIFIIILHKYIQPYLAIHFVF
jgi:hypothetical protein